MNLIARRRAIPYVVVLLVASASILLPSSAFAVTGGVGLGPAGSTPTPSKAATSKTVSRPTSTLGTVQPGDGNVAASGNGISIATRQSAILRQQLRFAGTVPATADDQVIELERRGRETGGNWANTAHATAGPGGAFAIVWNTNHIGRFQFRAIIGAATAARTAAASPPVTAIVYKPAIATWYGSALYGRTTACGETLGPTTYGVANRTLPCGTMVSFYYQGRTIVVPVIDRGPYGRADWDLTEATAKKLGTLEIGVATVGAVSLPGS